MTGPDVKAAGAFRTIGEVAAATGLQQHVLRYWETRFPQLRPLTRAGNRRYYRPEDVELIERINRLLNQDGYTVKGVQKLFASEGKRPPPDAPGPAPVRRDTARLRAVRGMLRRALDEDEG
ncbi:MerR family transcriptional regulator [uncultured Sphingomonas sp.]|uniref:MerR family transcriptional regulator n=1 Tax=uncultured Sphingomonas sp. TaxID=158754 RepID=UPI002612A032|nr:MerR family transcriptional regulator [uncultured Sphingomonas sp.]